MREGAEATDALSSMLAAPEVATAGARSALCRQLLSRDAMMRITTNYAGTRSTLSDTAIVPVIKFLFYVQLRIFENVLSSPPDAEAQAALAPRGYDDVRTL